MNVGKMLLDDRRAALMRQVERAVAGGGVLAAFAWYWLPKSPGMEIDIGPIIAGAVSAKGASRTFREVAVLGYAIAAGKTDADVIAAFNSGTAQMAGRDFDVVGTRAPVCNDCAALLGLSLGAARLRNESVKQWLTEACRLSTTRQNISVCDRSLLDLATALLSDQPVSPPKHSPLLLATHARGLLPPGAESESAAVSFLKMLPSRFDLTDEEAVLCLAALEWLLRSAPAVEIGAPSIRAVRDVLARSGASLHRWVIEDQPKTQGKPARQWHIDNEYHVQSLLWAVLAPTFADLREEEWLASVGQKKPRADLCLPGLHLIIEVKFWRHGTKVQDLIEQVAADTSLYLTTGSPYTAIIVYIWDDTGSSDQHHVLQQGLRSLQGIVDVFIQARPSRFGAPTLAARSQAAVRPKVFPSEE